MQTFYSQTGEGYSCRNNLYNFSASNEDIQSISKGRPENFLPSQRKVIKYARILEETEPEQCYLQNLHSTHSIVFKSKTGVKTRRLATINLGTSRSSRSLELNEVVLNSRRDLNVEAPYRRDELPLGPQQEYNKRKHCYLRSQIKKTAITTESIRVRPTTSRSVNIDQSLPLHQNLSRLSSSTKQYETGIKNKSNTGNKTFVTKTNNKSSSNGSKNDYSYRNLTSRKTPPKKGTVVDKRTHSKSEETERSPIRPNKKSENPSIMATSTRRSNSTSKSITTPKSTVKNKPNLNVEAKVNTFIKKKITPNQQLAKALSKIPNEIGKNVFSDVKCMSASPRNISSKETDTHSTEINNPDNHESSTQVELKVPQINQSTETQSYVVQFFHQETGLQTDISSKPQSPIEELYIPEISLKNEKSAIINVFESRSIPNLKIPSNNTHTHSSSEEEITKSPSLIIGKATLTYTKQKEINFHMFETNSSDGPRSQSPLAAPYPFTVISMLKKKLKCSDEKHKKKIDRYSDSYSEIETSDIGLSCNISLLSQSLRKKKYHKKLDLLSTLKEKKFIDRSVYSEQFQKELSFIDSFLTSLQCLQNNAGKNHPTKTTALQKSYTKQSKNEKEVIEDAMIIAKLEKQGFKTSEEMQTMANKSLCLLNLLIQDEHRRAKNLLFALKLREDALKDFTKSQILWLENKKRTNMNIHASILKKKQRGALLKLQHECGEMQRMRKTLLMLSEKRKAALMQTKNNIELKLSNAFGVNEILLRKKSLRNINCQDNKTKLPLKCFELSSGSYCDESMDNKGTVDAMQPVRSDYVAIGKIKCEKGIQTGDSLIESLFTSHCEKLSENFISVDGGYLNILFHNLALPEIFSSGKEYEVNEVALENILESANRLKDPMSCVSSGVIDQFLNIDEKSVTSPSTARSLIDELDDYYNSFGDFFCKEKVEETSGMLVQDTSNEEKQADPTGESTTPEAVVERPALELVKDCELQLEKVDENVEEAEKPSLNKDEAILINDFTAVDTNAEVIAILGDKNLLTLTSSEFQHEDSPFANPESGGSDALHGSANLSTLSEAEELRKKQLAIELEIKALEQQQMLILREIPDKPPPPYTPPSPENTSAALPTSPTMDFPLDREKVKENVIHYCNLIMNKLPVDEPNLSDSFHNFLYDFSKESIQKYNVPESDKPWDPQNIIPQKSNDNDAILKKIVQEVDEILGYEKSPPAYSCPYVQSKKADFIDDIVFTEWKEREHEWTNLESDEVEVKNQLTESILSNLIDELVEDFKKLPD